MRQRRGFPARWAAIWFCCAWSAPIFSATLAATALNNPDLSVTFSTIRTWTGGFQGEFKIRNAGTASVSGWSLSFDLPATISSIWNGEIAAQNAGHYEISPKPWTLTVPVGGSVSVGFNANGADGPTQLTLIDPSAPEPIEQTQTATASSSQFTVTDPPAYTGFGPSLLPLFNYGEALQMAWYFYEAQRSGPLPKFDGDLPFDDPTSGARLHDGFLASRIPWRGDTDLQDGADVGLDLTGGWHDAGDHVKFGLPMAFSASFLAWSVLEFEQALSETGQLARAKDNLRWVGDYFIRAHPSPNVLYGQVGEGAVDHTIWGAPEVMPHFRPAWKIDLNQPGPDLAAQTAAAMAAISLVFRADEPAYADVLLQHAIELYDFAQATRSPETNSDKSLGRYSDSITDAQGYYASKSGAKDDLPFAAAWLYIATKTPRFLQDAEADYTRIADREGHHGWTAVWDDVRYGVYLLMAKIYTDADYAADSRITPAERHDGYFDYNLHAQNFLNHWLRDGGVARTPGGMAWLSNWGSARYNTMTAFLALVYRKHLLDQGEAPELQANYLKFATEQVNYVLGDNPLQLSYLVGFGNDFSQMAHHRAAHGSSTNSIYEPPLPRHVLYGGLAGGPDGLDAYTNDRADFARTEVANDINAGITGALAGLVDAYGITGNQADPNFPPAGPDYRELYVKARLETQQPTDLATGLEVIVVNETAYPPRDSDGYKFRYFINLQEIFDRGFSLDDLVVETYWTEGVDASGLQRWQDSAYVFYVEGSFEGVNITPLGNDKYQKHLKFIIRLPWAERGWDPANDPSYEGLVAGTEVVTDKIALYDTRLPMGQQLVWGIEPDPGILQSELPPPGDNPPPPANDFTITLDVYSSWATGYCNKFTITNSGTEPAQPMSISFVLPASVVITNSWNGTVTREGDNVEVALPVWIGVMQPGQSRTDFGFCASGTTLPQL